MSVKRIRLRYSQAGIASLMVTMVLMIVISLIVLGFAQISRRQQRETLDQQLNTQAFYAAETGVNEAKKVISNALANNNPVPNKNTCGDPGGSSPYSTAYNNRVIDSAHDVSYTCLLVSSEVPSLTKTLGPDQSWVVPVDTVDNNGNPAIPNQLRISWPAENGSAPNLSGCPNPPGGPGGTIRNLDYSTFQSCPFGVMRLDILPMYAGTFNQDTLLNNDMVTFFYPTTGGTGQSGQVSYTAGPVGVHQHTASCDKNLSPPTCSAIVDLTSLTSLPPASQPKAFYARISMLYKGTGTNGNVVVDANGQSGISFTGAQADIDATGRAQDILRRIKVAVSISDTASTNPFTPGVASRDSICKVYTVGQGLVPSVALPASSDNNAQCNGSGSIPSGGPTSTDNGQIGTRCSAGALCPPGNGGTGTPPAYYWSKAVWVTHVSTSPTGCELHPDSRNTFPNGNNWTMQGSAAQCNGTAPFYPNYGNKYPSIENPPIKCWSFYAQVDFFFNGSSTPTQAQAPVLLKVPGGTSKPPGC